MNVIETSGLGKRYNQTWALRECTWPFPRGTWWPWSDRMAPARPPC